MVAAAGGGGYVGYTRWVGNSPLEAVDTSTRQTGTTDGGTFAGNGYTVNVPGGAIAGDAQVVDAVVTAETLGNDVFGPALGIEHDQPLNGPIEVRWDITALTQPQRDTLILIRYNDDLGVWAADPPTLDVPYRIEGNELIADIDTWSFRSWDTIADIGQGIGELTGRRTDPPECSGSLPGWVDNTVIRNADSNAAAILACYEADADKGITAVSPTTEPPWV